MTHGFFLFIFPRESRVRSVGRHWFVDYLTSYFRRCSRRNSRPKRAPTSEPVATMRRFSTVPLVVSKLGITAIFVANLVTMRRPSNRERESTIQKVSQLVEGAMEPLRSVCFRLRPSALKSLSFLGNPHAENYRDLHGEKDQVRAVHYRFRDSKEDR